MVVKLEIKYSLRSSKKMNEKETWFTLKNNLLCRSLWEVQKKIERKKMVSIEVDGLWWNKLKSCTFSSTMFISFY